MCRREINKTVSSIIDDLEVPRATSAPPHLEERFAAQLVSANYPKQGNKVNVWPLQFGGYLTLPRVTVINSTASTALTPAQLQISWGSHTPWPLYLMQLASLRSSIGGLSGGLVVGQGALGNIQDGRWTPDGWSDIRCDEDYERFYQSQAEAGRKLPPPLDSRTVYAQLPPHLQQQLTQQQQQALAARLSPGPTGSLLLMQFVVLVRTCWKGDLLHFSSCVLGFSTFTGLCTIYPCCFWRCRDKKCQCI
jgi:hypothetical protein